jgi:hypothetical protein
MPANGICHPDDRRDLGPARFLPLVEMTIISVLRFLPLVEMTIISVLRFLPLVEMTRDNL